jgi:hypothetical protein
MIKLKYQHILRFIRNEERDWMFGVIKNKLMAGLIGLLFKVDLNSGDECCRNISVRLPSFRVNVIKEP